MPLILVGSYIN